MSAKLVSVRVLVFAVVIGLVLIGMVILTHNNLTVLYPGHNDFMSRWEGARSYWVDGLNPYGDEASLNIQERIYGRAVVDDEDPGFFAYPFYTAFLVLPLVFTTYAWASAVWMVLLEAPLGDYFHRHGLLDRIGAGVGLKAVYERAAGAQRPLEGSQASARP
jgi:hypothetical protein